MHQKLIPLTTTPVLTFIRDNYMTTFIFAAVFSSVLEPRDTQNKNVIQKLFRDQRSESIWLPHDWLTIRI
jgi:hypothetical protein